MWVAVATGLVAACLWYGSTLVTTPPTPERSGADGMTDASITIEEGGKTYDFFATLKRQARWNRCAALFTAISVGCQAVSVLLG